MAVVHTAWEDFIPLLKITDGTTTHTVAVFEEPYTHDVLHTFARGAQIYFNAFGNAWVTDGTTDGTEPLFSEPWFVVSEFDVIETPNGRVTNARPGFETGVIVMPEAGDPVQLLPYNDTRDYVQLDGTGAFISFDPHPNGVQVYQTAYVTDGTAAGTQSLQSLFDEPDTLGLAHPDLSGDAVLGDTLFFTARTQADRSIPGSVFSYDGRSIWATDGTLGGTERIDDAGKHVSISDFVPLGDSVVFTQRRVERLPDDGSGIPSEDNGTFEVWQIEADRDAIQLVDFPAPGTSTRDVTRASTPMIGTGRDGTEGIFVVTENYENVNGLRGDRFWLLEFFDLAAPQNSYTVEIGPAWLNSSVFEFEYTNGKIVGWDTVSDSIVAIDVGTGQSTSLGVDAPVGLTEGLPMIPIGDDLIFFAVNDARVRAFVTNGTAEGTQEMGIYRTTGIQNYDLETVLQIDDDVAYFSSYFLPWAITRYDSVTDTLSEIGEGKLLGVVDDSILQSYGPGPGDDRLSGTDEANTLSLGAGNDVYFGRGGNDTVTGEAGNDTIYGQQGNDSIDAGAGNDLVFGGLGMDEIYGGIGNDTLRGEAGSDRMFGGSGADLMLGGWFSDWLYGGAGNDRLEGEGGLDRLFGGNGNDILLGGAQDDRLFGAANDDFLGGGSGNDWLLGEGGRDVLSGDAGNDVLTGGWFSDRFVFRDGFGLDIITDFDPNNINEVIDLRNVSAIADEADLFANHMFQVGSDVEIRDLLGNVITVQNATLAGLQDGNDFLV